MSSPHVMRRALDSLRIAYPILLLVVFAASFIASSIVTARTANQNFSAAQTGPGGRPLPNRSRSSFSVRKGGQKFSHNAKIWFNLLSVAILVTFVAEAAANVSHVMVARSEHWWCGQSVVVCPLVGSVAFKWSRREPRIIANAYRYMLWVRSLTMLSYLYHY